MLFLVEVSVLLCVLFRYDVNGKEQQLLVNNKSEDCPNGIVYREGCKLCYCVEGLNGFVIHKCETKFTKRECDIIGNLAHCDEDNLFYNYDRECEGECDCNTAKNVTVCENLPCNNTVLSSFGFYNFNDSDFIDDSTKSKIDNARVHKLSKNKGRPMLEIMPKFPFQGRRMRRQNDADTTTVAPTTADSETTTITSITSTPITSSTAESTTITSNTAESTTITSNTAESTTITSNTAESTTITSNTAESTTITSNTAESTTITSNTAESTTTTSISMELTPLTYEEKETLVTKSINTTMESASESHTAAEEEQMRQFNSYTTDSGREENKETDHKVSPANRKNEVCPHGVYYRQGCEVCYCFETPSSDTPTQFCESYYTNEDCGYWSRKIHCDESRLEYNYNKKCEGSCKCKIDADELKTITTCQYLPCHNRILKKHGILTTDPF